MVSTLISSSFMVPTTVALMGEGPWPGPLLRSFTRSLARLLMPQALPEPLSVEGEAFRPVAWVMSARWACSKASMTIAP